MVSLFNTFAKGNETMTTEERLTKLERKNRRLTLGVVLAGLVATLAVAVGMAAPEAVPDEIKAHKFILVDAEGNTLALLGNTEKGPMLGLCNLKGDSLTTLGLSGLMLCDAKAKNRISLDAAEIASMLRLYDERGNPRAMLANTTEKGPVLVFFDEKGTIIWRRP